MGRQNLCTLFGPTLMKLSPKDNREIHVEDMGKEIKESMQQAQVLFYILQLHEEDRLISDPVNEKHQQNLLNLFNNRLTDKITDNNNEINENMSKLDVKQPNTAIPAAPMQPPPRLDRNNNNLSKPGSNSPENNKNNNNNNKGNVQDKYAKLLNMQTAL